MKYLLALSLASCAVDGVVLVLPIDAGAMDDAVIALDAQEAAVPPEAAVAVGVCRIGGVSDGFYESFDAPLDAPWLVADGTTSLATFRRENVALVDGDLVLTVGPDAAAIATRDLFASATYQLQARVADGVELALWWRRDDDADGSIDIASPGQGGDFARVRMRSYDGATASENQFAVVAPLNDGSDHILRFDRYTTDTPGVRFWVDDALRWETSEHLPTHRAGRMWIVATGSGVVRITHSFVTPFGNSGDACSDGELRGPGLLPP